VDRFSATILRGDKVGLIGPNGAGKTTLLKLILGELQPDQRQRAPGHQPGGGLLRPDARRQLDLDATLADTISPGSEWVEIGGQRKHVMSYLGDFLFAPERANSPVRTLSGGERNRLLLARLFALPANVLVLDEPTNDLDIETLELLEELLRLPRHGLPGQPRPALPRQRGHQRGGLGGRPGLRRPARAVARVRGRHHRLAAAARALARGAPSSATRSSASSTHCPRASSRWKPSRRPSPGRLPMGRCLPATRSALRRCSSALHASRMN
jgi:hypothetical protein